MVNIKHGIPSYYSAAQVQAYLQRINFPAQHEDAPSSFRADLANLEQLARLHLVAFPFENTRIHYTQNHDVDVEPQASYTRLVEQRLGGSWCYGQNGLFLGMLRGLGYRVYSSPARVNMKYMTTTGEQEYTRLSHLVLIVQLDNAPADAGAGSRAHTTYLVDVGFGGFGLVRPIPLEVGNVFPGSAPPEEHRLMRVMYPESSLEEDDASRQWVLQYRCAPHQPEWTIAYLFSDYETHPADWVASSQWLSAHPVNLFRDNVITIRHFFVEDGQRGPEAPMGRLVMIGNRVQRRVGNESVTVKEFTTERERIQILKDDFGITIEEGEISNTLGTPVELPLQ